MPYQVAIFDLDNCLMDARVVGPLFEPAFDAIRRANQGMLTPAVLEQSLHQCWYTAFDLVATRYHYTPAMREAGWNAFSQMQVGDGLEGYTDLALVPNIPLRRYLVTSGFRRLQTSKIRALGIGPWFERVDIDAIDEGDGPHGKRPLFEQILEAEGCTADEVLVIGDNPLSELGVGQALGMTTVQTVRPGVRPWDEADYRVEGLAGVLELVATAHERA